MISSYLKYLPAVLAPPTQSAGQFSLGQMLCVFEKLLTGLNDGIAITHGDNSIVTTVTQMVTGSAVPQIVRVTAGTGTKFVAGSSYTYNGATPEVINITATTVNSITAVIRQDHAANQTILNNSGPRSDVQTVIAGLVELYGAWTAPPNYLDWLAQWVALQFDPEWDEYQRRTVLSTIVGIYKDRGTKRGLDKFFDIYAIAKQPTRVVVDNKSKILFCKPQQGLIVPVSTLVSQRPLVAPQCAAYDENGFLLVCDLGSGDGTIQPALWRISSAGQYDYSAGSAPQAPMAPQPPMPQPFQPATLELKAPIAVALDQTYGGAYLIDFGTDWVLYRLTTPQTGVISLTGAPNPTQTATITIAGTSYLLPETGGPGLNTQAAGWAAALNLATPFPSSYVANEQGPTIVIAPLSGVPMNDLTLVTSTSNSLVLSASGPCYGASTIFANDVSSPPLGLKYPIAMVVNSAGNPLVLDRGAAPGSPSAAAIVEVQITVTAGVPKYSGTVSHAFAGTIVEPLAMLLRADGSLVIGDGGNQSATTPANLITIDTATWTATGLLSSLPSGANPLITPTGIVEVDAQHLMILDAGLRPFNQSGFTAVVAQQAAIYSVDLSLAVPAIARVSEFKALVYPRGMVSDGDGTLYICDSGLPDIAGYNSILWRSGPQQFSVVAHFQGDEGEAFFCIQLVGTPNTGQQCSVTIGASAYTLTEVTGYTLAEQATAWAASLNNNPSFGALYVALGAGSILCLYALPNTITSGLTTTPGSSADVTLTPITVLSPLPVGTITLSGEPTGGESCWLSFQIGLLPSASCQLIENGGSSLEEQATTWCTQLNATPSFSASLVANNSQGTINIFATIAMPPTGISLSTQSSLHLTLAVYLASQDHEQFLQSIRDVVSDQIPAQALWALQSA